MDIRDILLELSSGIVEKDVAICLSGGIDSFSVMLALLEVGKNVHAYSFTLEDRKSSDFLCAENISSHYGVEFTPIILPTNYDILERDIRIMATKYGARTKTEFECTWPFIYVYKNVTEKVIATGIPADGHFCLSKSGMIHFRNNVDSFRTIYFNKPNAGQRVIRKALADEYGKINFDPYYSELIEKRLHGLSWNELNKPRQKMPIYESFKDEFDKFKIGRHTNYQKGDSGISDLFKQVGLEHGYKSSIGYFNKIVKEECHGTRI